MGSMLGRGVRNDVMREEADKGKGSLHLSWQTSQSEEATPVGSDIRETKAGSGESHGLGDLSKKLIATRRCPLE